jgi:hypothetical protein
MSDDEEKRLPVQAHIVGSGFEDGETDNDRLIQGELVKCIDGHWTFKNGKAVPPDTVWFALDCTTALQRFTDERVETIRKKPGEPLPDPDELNADIPRSEWETGLDGEPRPPWSKYYVVYLLNPKDASICTFCNDTWGALRAYDGLRQKVKWMRAMRGASVVPLVRPDSEPMPTHYGVKMRPEFTVIEWRDLGGGSEAPALTPDPSPQLEDKNKAAGKPVEPVSTEEDLDDEIPF